MIADRFSNGRVLHTFQFRVVSCASFDCIRPVLLGAEVFFLVLCMIMRRFRSFAYNLMGQLLQISKDFTAAREYFQSFSGETC